ncbi:MAG: 3-isopropylmalate dehydratase large subunit [Hyphomonadaceae bacterium]|nr:3-isopropylmalate dehydratase large subunit [Hyphomonadaceae bacterium]
MTTPQPRTLYQKIWDDHVIAARPDGACLLWIDRHLIHEVTTPQAFQGLREAGRKVHRPDLTLAVPDHNVPTRFRERGINDPRSAQQLELLETNCEAFGIELIHMNAPDQGIVHVIGPEQGFTLPGVTLVCGDSHTSTHGAFGALAFGIGTSEIEHVFATQTLLSRPSRTMQVHVTGKPGFSITPKDVALAIVSAVGAGGANGHVVEYTGEVIERMSMEGRMTVCNMSIEFGGRAGLIAPDETTFAYLKSRPRAPKGTHWEQAMAFWSGLRTDLDAAYDKIVEVDASAIAPLVTWGTSPDQSAPVTAHVPDPQILPDKARREAACRALDYMDLKPGQPLQEIEIDYVFIGSCTNSRIEDLRAAATVLKAGGISERIQQAIVVPGSGAVKRQAEAEGLDKVFLDAGFEWREPGCSMCLAMNEDKVPVGLRCASTSNRNFEGRQGPGARTHLMSPAMAAAAARRGRLTDVREIVKS